MNRKCHIPSVLKLSMQLVHRHRIPGRPRSVEPVCSAPPRPGSARRSLMLPPGSPAVREHRTSARRDLGSPEPTLIVDEAHGLRPEFKCQLQYQPGQVTTTVP